MGTQEGVRKGGEAKTGHALRDARRGSKRRCKKYSLRLDTREGHKKRKGERDARKLHKAGKKREPRKSGHRDQGGTL